jgi:hypothetical protein
MAVLPFVRESDASLLLADRPAEHKRGRRPFGSSDMFFSSGQGVSGLLPTLWPIRVRPL